MIMLFLIYKHRCFLHEKVISPDVIASDSVARAGYCVGYIIEASFAVMEFKIAGIHFLISEIS